MVSHPHSLLDVRMQKRLTVHTAIHIVCFMNTCLTYAGTQGAAQRHAEKPVLPQMTSHAVMHSNIVCLMNMSLVHAGAQGAAQRQVPAAA